MKIGDKVKINSESVFFKRQGLHGIGEIIKISRGLYGYRVKFEDEYKNTYNKKDLICISWKERFK